MPPVGGPGLPPGDPRDTGGYRVGPSARPPRDAGPPAAPPGGRHSGAFPAVPYAGEGPGAYDNPYGDSYDDAYGEDVYGDEVYDDAYGDEDDEDLGRRRGCRTVLAVLALLAVAGVVGGFFAWRWVREQVDPPGSPGQRVIVEIEPGFSTAQIGDALEENGIIRNAFVWQWYTRVNRVSSIQAGQYEMQRNSSYDEAIEVLEAGPLPPDADTVTIPEGFTVAQIVGRLTDPEEGVEGFSAPAVLAALNDPAMRSEYLPDGQTSKEGTLFPETYRIEEGDDEAALIARMVEQFDAVMGELDARSRAHAVGLSPYEVVIVASLVEGETRVDEERGKVARLIYNRLDRNEPLAIDATSCYEKDEDPCTLTAADLESDSPYNTRVRPGLPPTPIASPGRASLEAALNPPDGDWLYSVLDADGDGDTHIFTADYDEFVEAKQRCQDAGMCG
ncbi:MAG: endolytic transglycosylase MltG [Acidimicrobiia bacterium]